ncbi:MAG TPA: aldehyde ferredoxin oxidoreductase family protein [Thermodesulfobacteriota bacterium]|nr:aldehyde ferredoxin oxidoreductase family protein [Thermodesulfobacteriota bacterium]
MNGYTGRILHIDLTQQKFKIQNFDEAFAKKFLGGNGFAAKILYDGLKKGIDPFSPENLVVLAVGPVTDSPLPSTSRAYVATKSPLNGLFFDSTFGGRFAITQKRTGFEAIVISGKAASPVYLVIDETGAQFKSAGPLWGKLTKETFDAIQAVEGEPADVVAIGPAGEKKVRYACLVHYWRGREGVSGRGGVGAVLGAKNLKAVVVKGSKRTQVADSQAIQELIASRKEPMEKGTAGLKNLGTPVLVNMINTIGGLGVRNLQEEQSPHAPEIGGERLKELFFDRNDTCFGCPIACGKTLRLPPEQGGLRWKMPEYETLFSLGSMADNWDAASMLKLNRLCDQYGLDTISMGVTISFALECFEKGYLTSGDTGGRNLHFGDSALLLELVEDTGKRQGFGDVLAEGSFRLAERLGKESANLLYCFKKVEVAGHSARALKGMSLGYATATRGGSHHDARPTLQYAGEFDRTKAQIAPAFAFRTQNFTAMNDSLTQCRFASERGFGGVINENYSKMINGVTGWNFTLEDIEKIGERIYNLERAFNCREGVTRMDDALPYRASRQPISDGPSKGMYTPGDEFDGMLEEYYRLRGWDSNGIPTREKFMALGLEGEARDLK